MRKAEKFNMLNFSLLTGAASSLLPFLDRAFPLGKPFPCSLLSLWRSLPFGSVYGFLADGVSSQGRLGVGSALLNVTEAYDCRFV